MNKFDNIKVRVMIGAESAYACIKLPNKSTDVLLSRGCSPEHSLKESAQEAREKAARLLEQADVMDAAAEKLAGEKVVRRMRG